MDKMPWVPDPDETDDWLFWLGLVGMLVGAAVVVLVILGAFA